MNITTIVLINGLWISALGWELWVQHYTDKGYRVIAADWPGREGEIEQLRGDPSHFASLGLKDVVDYYEQLIRELETPPISLQLRLKAFANFRYRVSRSHFQLSAIVSTSARRLH